MLKESSLLIKICDWIIKYFIYTAIFLTPLFFLPFTSDVLDFNKQTFILIVLSLALFAWIIKTLVVGKLKLNISHIHIILGVLFLAYVLATAFSINPSGSFWGWPQSPAESLLSFIALFIAYFLISNVFSIKEIFTSVKILLISALVAQIFGIFQLLGLFIIPFEFAKNIAFSTIGSAGGLGFFTAIMLPLAIVMIIFSKKWWRFLFSLNIIASAIVLFLISYPMVWWTVILGSAVVMILGVIKKDAFDGRWMALPMFFLGVGLFFIILNPHIQGITQKANELYLTHGSSLKINMQVLKERPIFGSGPGTFSYNFAKFKDPEVSKSDLWNINFTKGSSKVFTDLATTGIFGFIALLAVIIFPVFYGIKHLVAEKFVRGESDSEKEKQKVFWLLFLGVTASVTAQGLTFFLYNSNVVLNFVYFFLIACIVSFITKEKKEYELKSSSFTTLVITFVFTLIFIFGVGLLVLDGQKYIAEANYFSGINLLQAKNIDQGVKNIEKAASLNPAADLYYRQLSQIYLAQLQILIQGMKSEPTDEQRKKIELLLSDSINAGKLATNMNVKNATNWASLGYIYQSLFGFVGGADASAITAYDEAAKLDPNNPYIYAQQGNIFYLSATQGKAEQKNEMLGKAKDKLEKAVGLNPNYSNGLYSLGLVYDALGQKDKAIEQFTRVQQLQKLAGQTDETITKILSNLKAGLPALQSPTPLVEAPPDGTDKQPEGSASTTEATDQVKNPETQKK